LADEKNHRVACPANSSDTAEMKMRNLEVVKYFSSAAFLDLPADQLAISDPSGVSNYEYKFAVLTSSQRIVVNRFLAVITSSKRQRVDSRSPVKFPSSRE
jgi:hypothetical protein